MDPHTSKEGTHLQRRFLAATPATPYIGITGPTSVEQVQGLLDSLRQVGYSMASKHIPMIGILVSQKSVAHLPVNRRYPQFEAVPSLLETIGPQAFATIHYNTKETETLGTQILSMLRSLPDPDACQGIQLNIIAPPVDEVVKVKMKHPWLKIILQANERMIADSEPEQVADTVASYGRTIDYVLIDRSGGAGKGIDISQATFLYEHIAMVNPELTVGFAGGLGEAGTSDTVRRIIDRIGIDQFSIDAEGALRDKHSDAWGDDDLNLEKAQSYLQDVSRVLK